MKISTKIKIMVYIKDISNHNSPRIDLRRNLNSNPNEFGLGPNPHGLSTQPQPELAPKPK